MPALSPFRALALLAFAFLATTVGCSRGPAPAGRADLANSSAQTPPRSLQLPDRLQRLDSGGDESIALSTTDSTFAGFEQLGGGPSPVARIRELSGTPAASSPDLIREPALPSEIVRAPVTSDEPKPTASARSEYVPVEIPAESSFAPQAQLPELPPRPSYAASSLRASRDETIAQSEQPQMAPPSQPIRSEAAFQPEPQTQFAPTAQPAADPAAMQPVAQRAAEISDHAFGLANRGMLFAARAELIESLQLVAQALDVQQRTSSHAAALAAGLTALKEAQDFAAQSGNNGAVVNVAEIVRGHQTPVLKATENISPVVAQQQYFGYAQAQLVIAAGQQPVASQTLYRLGRVQMAMAEQDSDSRALQAPQAIVYYQASLAADQRNHLAANELGVLMARYGQLQEARRLLVHSVSVQPHVEAWHNLSVVHQRLGEADLARRADHERQLLAQRSPASPAAGNRVAWVDAQTFAAAGGSDVPVSETAQTARQPTLRGSASFGKTR